jgi:anti-sigma factor RsiW
LADALDGLLKPEDEAIFTAHMAVCPACTALFEESRRGREWLEFLSPEPEVPCRAAR